MLFVKPPSRTRWCCCWRGPPRRPDPGPGPFVPGPDRRGTAAKLLSPFFSRRVGEDFDDEDFDDDAAFGPEESPVAFDEDDDDDDDAEDTVDDDDDVANRRIHPPASAHPGSRARERAVWWVWVLDMQLVCISRSSRLPGQTWTSRRSHQWNTSSSIRARDRDGRNESVSQ